MARENFPEDYPRAYKEGEAEFFGRKFLVTPDVLIPRPETEEVVEAVLRLAGKAYIKGIKMPPSALGGRPRILEIGTGSGVVATTLKLEIPEAEVFATDISLPALRIAQKNAEKLGAGVKFFWGDLMEDLQEFTEVGEEEVRNFERRGKLRKNEEDFGAENGKKWEVVVANLPYVDKNWEWLSEPESAALKYEPSLALYAKEGGLELIFRLIRQVAQRTRYLVLEADPCQHEKIREFAEKYGFEKEATQNSFSLVLRSA